MKQTIKSVAMRYCVGACLALVVSVATVSCGSKDEAVKPQSQTKVSTGVADSGPGDPPGKPTGPGGG